MKKIFVITLTALAFTVSSGAIAAKNRKPASAPTDCLGAKDSEEAFLSNVEAALVTAHYKAVPRKNIKKTATDEHDPEYDVKLDNGKKVHVTCDDSGDDQCNCEVAE